MMKFECAARHSEEDGTIVEQSWTMRRLDQLEKVKGLGLTNRREMKIRLDLPGNQ